MTEAALYMDAEIRPNRSLSERGFIILISVITAVNVASAAVFVRMGAPYVLPFLGIDLLAIIVAFLASFLVNFSLSHFVVFRARDLRGGASDGQVDIKTDISR